jgi:hypothetical protein
VPRPPAATPLLLRGKPLRAEKGGSDGKPTDELGERRTAVVVCVWSAVRACAAGGSGAGAAAAPRDACHKTR